jgi:hypothetical protein
MPSMKARVPAWLCALLLGCTGKAGPERCEAMVVHLIELHRAAHQGRAAEIVVEVASERRAALLERCLADGTVAEVECVLAAPNLEAVQRCAP